MPSTAPRRVPRDLPSSVGLRPGGAPAPVPGWQPPGEGPPKPFEAGEPAGPPCLRIDDLARGRLVRSIHEQSEDENQVTRRR
jgi:hypothetical protein